MKHLTRIRTALREETAGFHPRLDLVQLVVALLPPLAGLRLRRVLYRLAGLSVGNGTVIMGGLRITGEGPIARKLRIGSRCVLNERIYFNLGGPVELEDRVTVGMESIFLTVSHRIGSPEFRAGETVTQPIRVGAGAWLGARVTVLPGVTVGNGTVVGAGSVITGDLPEHVLAAGVPARVIRPLEEPPGMNPAAAASRDGSSSSGREPRQEKRT
jgi:maltose O-acetyltransferase